LFNSIYSFLKNFKNNSKSYKINIYFFKDKKKNFKNSLLNFSVTNKNKTWLKNKVAYFNNKNSTIISYSFVIKLIITILIIYFKFNIICYYFSDVLPYDIFFGLDSYIEFFTYAYELLINLLIITTLFLSILLTNVFSFFNINLNINLYCYNFFKKNYNNIIPIKSNKLKVIKWRKLSKTTNKAKVFNCDPNLNIIDNNKFKKNVYNYLTNLKITNSSFLYINFKSTLNNKPLINQNLLSRNNSIQNNYWEILNSIKSITSKTKSNKFLNNSNIWFFNKNNIFFKLNNYSINSIYLKKLNLIKPFNPLKKVNLSYNFNMLYNYNYYYFVSSNNSKRINSFFLKKKN
jgi:hypothetical protein